MHPRCSIFFDTSYLYVQSIDFQFNEWNTYTMDQPKVPQSETPYEIEDPLENHEPQNVIEKPKPLHEPVFTGWNTVFALLISLTVLACGYGIYELILIKTQTSVNNITNPLANLQNGGPPTVPLQPIVTTQSSNLPTSSSLSSSVNSTSVQGQAPCEAMAMKATVVWQIASGSALGVISFTNTAQSACSLTGNPIIQLKDVSGFQYLTTTTDITDSNNKTNTNKTGTVIMQPNTTVAQVSFSWQGCVPRPTGSIQVYATVPNATLPILATSVDQNGKPIASQSIPTCQNGVTPSNQSTLLVGSFMPAQ